MNDSITIVLSNTLINEGFFQAYVYDSCRYGCSIRKNIIVDQGLYYDEKISLVNDINDYDLQSLLDDDYKEVVMLTNVVEHNDGLVTVQNGKRETIEQEKKNILYIRCRDY